MTQQAHEVLKWIQSQKMKSGTPLNQSVFNKWCNKALSSNAYAMMPVLDELVFLGYLTDNNHPGAKPRFWDYSIPT
ncbi:hypothetical protein ACIPMZ_21050 [Scandinavium goeteborgense]|uniref:hypothetical protein n=1 Tax=Scandinavium goeteborgense TaxID=1851514 RepID=UPI003824FAAB